MATDGSARVLHGFEEPMREALGMLARARHVVMLFPEETFNEFMPPMVTDIRALALRGVTPRIAVARGDGTVSGAELRDAHVVLSEAGAEVHFLPESREVAFMATDQELLVFPHGQHTTSPLTPCVIVVRDAIAVAHFRLAFERVWERSQPPEVHAARRKPA